MSGPTPLPRAFFAREADVVARDLVGRLLVNGERVGRIVETEAYFGPPGANPRLEAREDLPKRLRDALVTRGDPAAHSFPGPTPRNKVMFGPAGHAYVYLIYGMHECMNVATGADGHPQAVLLRALEPVTGLEVGARTDGPGRLTRAMGISRAHYGDDVTEPPLFFADAPPARRVKATPRVNVVGAEWYPLRFLDAESSWVSRPARPKKRRTRKA